MARNDISFDNVVIPRLGTGLLNTGIDAINKGIQGFKGIVDTEQTRQNDQQALQQDLDLDALRTMAKTQLGGKQAGETLEDYNASIDNFLKENGALTEDLGAKDISAFKTDFEEFATKQRDTQENRALTVRDRERENVAFGRAEDEFARKDAEREGNDTARQIVAAHGQSQEALKKRLLAGDPTLTADDIRAMSTDGSIRSLENQMRDVTTANPVFMDSLLNREIASKQRLVLSPAESTALATRQKQEERFYSESIGKMKIRDARIQKEIEKLDVQLELAPDDTVGGTARYVEGLRAIAPENLDEKVSEDIITEVQELMTEYTALGHNPADIASAALASTELADKVFGIRIDEDIDAGAFAQNLQFAKNARESRNKQQANLEALGQQTVTQRPSTSTARPTPASISEVTNPPPVAEPAQPALPTPVADPTADSVAALQAEASALQAGQPEDPLTQAQANKSEQLTLKPTEVVKASELKLIAIDQLTESELEEVQPNLDAAIKKIGRNPATTAQEVLRGQLLDQMVALRGKLRSFQDDTPESVSSDLVLPAPPTARNIPGAG